MKRGRHNRNEDVLYGRRPILEMLKAGRRRVARVLIAAEAQRARELDEIMALAASAGADVQNVPRRAIQDLVGPGNHQGVAARVGLYSYRAEKELPAKIDELSHPPLLLLLDHLEDPQNVGSLLRTAEACAVDAIIIPKNRAVGVTPAVVRASAGAAEHLCVVRVTNLVRCMRLLREQGVCLVGLEGVPESTPIDRVDLREPLGLVVGGESRGLRRLVREACDVLACLPRGGRVGSLNAAVAGAMALYEAVRQRSARQ